jgi:hypothetical protein
MLSVTIDADLLAPPTHAATPEAVRAYVDRLVDWSTVASSGQATICVSGRLSDLLSQLDLYPVRPLLRELFASTNIVEFDPNTVATIVDKMLSRAPLIEDLLQVSDLLLSDINCIPDIFRDHYPPELRAESERCAAIISIASRYATNPAVKGHALAIKAVIGLEPVNIRMLVDYLENTRSDLNVVPLTPNDCNGLLLACNTFRNYLTGFPVAELLQGVNSQADLEQVVSLALLRVRFENNLPSSENNLRKYRLGRHFLESCQLRGVLTQPALGERSLRAIVETLERQSLQSTHHIRTDEGPNSAQLKRGSDCAWRRDIDREYHLHYWECANDVVELASIVAHNDYSIS